MAKTTFAYFLVIIALFLRLLFLAKCGLWLDEYTSIEVASRSLGDIITGSGFDSHTPPLYYLLLHFWFYIAPKTEIGLRLPSVIFDALNVYLLLKIFSRQFSFRIGATIAVLHTLSPFAIYYSQEGRMYTLLMFFVLLLYKLALKYLRGKRKLGMLAATSVVTALGLYTHYYFALSLFAITVALLIKLRRDFMSALAWFSAAGIGSILFLPWAGIVLRLAAQGGQSFRHFSLAAVPYTFFRFVAGYAVLPLNYGTKENLAQTVLDNWPLILPYLLVFGVAFLVGLTKFRHLGPLTMCALIIPPGLALLLSIFAPMFSERYLAVSFPFFEVVLAFCLVQPALLARGVKLLCGLLIIFALYQHYQNSNFGKEQWRDVAAYLSANASNPKTVLVNPEYTKGVLEYYLKSPFRVLRVGKDVRASELSTLVTPQDRELWLVERLGAGEIIVPSALVLEEERLFPFESGIRVTKLREPN